MKRLFQNIWPELAHHKKLLTLAMLAGIIFSGVKSLVPILMKELVGSWENGNQEMATWLPWSFLLLGIIAGFFRYYNSFSMKLIGELVSLRLRRKMMRKYLQLSPGFVGNADKSGSAGLISRLINDINAVQNEVWRFSDLIKEPTLIAINLLYLLYLDYRLTLFALLFFPATILILKYFSRSLRKYGMISQGVMEKLAKTLKESLDGVRVVQSYSLENEMENRFNKEAYSYLSARKKIISRESVSGPLNEGFAMFILSFILVYVGQQILNGKLQIEDFLAFLVSIMLIIAAIRNLNETYVRLVQVQVSLERVRSVMSEPEGVRQSENPKDFPKNWKNINFDKVNFSFEKGKPILKNINLKVKEGEVVAFVGHSGAGKSTIMNLIERFCEPDSGSIYIGDTLINDIPINEFRKEISLVTQDVFLFSDSIEKNILFGCLEKPLEDVIKVAKAANAHEFILKTKNGYQTLLDDRGANLSGGERQRISIARALLKDAPIIILDEATSALDSGSEREVQRGLDSLIKGRTVFVVAHRLSTITQADRIVVLDKGEIAEEGSHRELLARKGLYYKFQKLQGYGAEE